MDKILDETNYQLYEEYLNFVISTIQDEELLSEISRLKLSTIDSNETRAIYFMKNNLDYVTIASITNLSIKTLQALKIIYLPSSYILDSKLENQICAMNSSSNLLKLLSIEIKTTNIQPPKKYAK